MNLGVKSGQESKTIYSQESQESGQAYRRKVEKGRSEDSPSIANIETAIYRKPERARIYYVGLL